MSNSERATMLITHGISMLESLGTFPGGRVVADAVSRVISDIRRTR